MYFYIFYNTFGENALKNSILYILIGNQSKNAKPFP